MTKIHYTYDINILILRYTMTISNVENFELFYEPSSYVLSCCIYSMLNIINQS